MKLRTVLLVGLPLIVAGVLVWNLTRDYPLDDDATPDDLFKYGSIGSETGGTLLHPIGGLLPPAPIFKALPSVCTRVADAVRRAPRQDGERFYAIFGLIYEPSPSPASVADQLPVGISRRRRLGMDMLGVNCALCHAGTVRDTPDAPPRVVPGMPPQQVDVQRLFRFIFDCVEGPEFTTANVLAAIERAENRRLWVHERVRYRLLVPRIRGQVRDLDAKIGVLTGDRVLASGPGRLDTISPGKALEVGWDLGALLEGARREELTATTDFPPAWNLAVREKDGFRLHWDGNLGTVKETLFSAALAVGAKPQTLDVRQFNKIVDYLHALKPPAHPFPPVRELVAEGAELFKRVCSTCHGDGVTGDAVGRVTSNDSLKVDAHRLNAFSALYASRLPVALNANYGKSEFHFTTFQKTAGYANLPLDGVWVRGPYLHNGSVPTLYDLLQPPRCRPPRFYRGSDVYDQGNVGFVSYAEHSTDPECLRQADAPPPGPAITDVPEAARRQLFLFDTAVPGNHNTGHDFGTDLSAAQKKALVEFLKTL